MTSLKTSSTLVAIAFALLVIGVALALNNPTVRTSHGATYDCLAPYDSVIGGNTDPRGMPDDSLEIADGCKRANDRRFALAAAVGVSGLGVGLTGVVLKVRRRKRL